MIEVGKLKVQQLAGSLSLLSMLRATCLALAVPRYRPYVLNLADRRRMWRRCGESIALAVLLGFAVTNAAIDPAIKLTVNSTSIKNGDMVEVRDHHIWLRLAS